MLRSAEVVSYPRPMPQLQIDAHGMLKEECRTLACAWHRGSAGQLPALLSPHAYRGTAPWFSKSRRMAEAANEAAGILLARLATPLGGRPEFG